LKLLATAAVIFIALLVASPAAFAQGTQHCGGAPSRLNGQRLTFDDEFACDSSLKAVWHQGVINFAPFDTANVALSGGTLGLTVNAAGGALVSTYPAFSFTYGTVEVRADIPYVGSTVVDWPAIWMLGTPNSYAGGEIDVTEGLSGLLCFTVHDATNDYTGGCASGTYAGWHTYAATWTPTAVTFRYDGTLVGTITQDITGSPMYLALDDVPSNPIYTNAPNVVPSTMRVAYVRVYQ
jgi:hypothetical protein